MRLGIALFAAFTVLLIAPASAQDMHTVSVTPPVNPTSIYYVRYDHWTAEDERGFGEFITAIGDSGCSSVNRCLHDPANPFRASDPDGTYFRADCADLPYVLRFYYAWKRGLPFGYQSVMEPRGRGRDIRYTARGNDVAERMTVRSGERSGYGVMETLSDAISSAAYRIHPELEEPNIPDHYSPAINPKSIRPGTVIYDPNGHVATVYRVDADGRIHYIDAHPDNSLTRGFYDLRFVRAFPGMGAGFKNWRSPRLVGGKRERDGTYSGGIVVLPKNAEIADYSVEQFFGNGTRPDDDHAWREGEFWLNGDSLDYYDYVRARLAGGRLEFDPVKEVRDMVVSNCADLHYRADAVSLATSNGLINRNQPASLPDNIYGTDGDWETYSTPSRDARLKTAFKELRDAVARYLAMYRANDPHLKYKLNNLPVDLLTTYDRTAAQCTITYTNTNGAKVSFGYEEARRRLFAMSFDPYHCIERRWGASDARELASCRDGETKLAWYAAEQNLRNQIDRTYDVQMGFSLGELNGHVSGSGVPAPPDTDVRTFLWLNRAVQRGTKPVARQ
ncbi:MAG: hypothetical protein JO167_03460 [Alphaproteobacteria bacterium]|nr:hypothetical protein [Alphaproteobacteria bacterium]